MHRRQVLGLIGTVLSGGLAGCSGGGGTDTATPSPTSTPTATPTATDTSTPTPTTTTTPTPLTHDLGETFTVGTGDTAIEYIVRGLYRAQELGPTGTEQPDHTFLIVVLTVSNLQSEAIDVPAPNIKLRGGGQIKNVDRDASSAAGSDDRLDVESLASATVPPNESSTGVLVYDAPTGNDYRLEFAPTGSTDDPHFVTVGDIADVAPLSEY